MSYGFTQRDFVLRDNWICVKKKKENTKLQGKFKSGVSIKLDKSNGRLYQRRLYWLYECFLRVCNCLNLLCLKVLVNSIISFSLFLSHYNAIRIDMSSLKLTHYTNLFIYQQNLSDFKILEKLLYFDNLIEKKIPFSYLLPYLHFCNKYLLILWSSLNIRPI